MEHIASYLPRYYNLQDKAHNSTTHLSTHLVKFITPSLKSIVFGEGRIIKLNTPKQTREMYSCMNLRYLSLALLLHTDHTIVKECDSTTVNKTFAREMAKEQMKNRLQSTEQEPSELSANESKITSLPSLSSPPLLKLPPELLLDIVDRSSACGATCFGLTCKKIYAIYKTKYSSLVSLDEYEFLILREHEKSKYFGPLGKLLSNWRGIGPRFRNWQPQVFKPSFQRIRLPTWHFVPIAIYGEASNPRRFNDMDRSRLESDLYMRYQDYYLMQIDGQCYLPYPRNKTREDWEREATEAVLQDRERHVDRFAWTNFWKDTTFFFRHSREILIHEHDMQNIALYAEMLEQLQLKAWIEEVA
jgi:hypothetical protein